MKKTLVALATLAATASFAQSSVTMYGWADMWFGQTTTGIGAGKLSQTRLNSGGINGSRFGLRGSEDLGGGMAANFVFENGFSLDTGVTSTSNAGVLTGGAAAGSATPAAAAGTVDAIFGRQAFVGLSGGFGNVRLGRQYSAYDDLRGGTDTLGHSSFSSTVANGAWENVGLHYTFRVNNMMRYETPNMGGFSAAVGYGLGENKTATRSADSVTSMHARYANGPIVAGLALQTEKNGTALTSLKNTLFAGSYDLGAAKINLGINNASATGGLKDKEFQAGVTVPLGATSVALAYGSSKASTAGVTTAKGTTLGLQAIYSLSKRTSVYGGLVNTDIKNGAGVKTNKLAVTAVGLRHNF
jgi:predicted porin